MLTDSLKNRLRSHHWLSIGMLATLHGALVLGTESLWARPLLLTHLGLFLLWQPLWRGERKLSAGGAAFIVGLSLVALLWLNWWVLAFWVSGLFALVGGRVFAFQSRWQRYYYLSMMVYLLAVLLLWLAPHLFDLSSLADTMRGLMTVAMPLLLLVMVFFPSREQQPEASQAVDFIYSVLLFTLLTLLVLGSLAFMTLERIGYLDALLRTLFIIALMLFVLGWLWNPKLGFSGLQALFSRYLLNIGTPFELWLKQLAETAQQETNPAAFLHRATAHMSAMPWLSGMAWVCDEGHGNLGLSSPNRIEVSDQDLHLTLFCRQAVSPSVLLHIHLLTQLLGHFYQAKRREQKLREMARLQAIYETGARLTHDLKNMLQSLLALTSVAQHQPEKAQPILQRQLPVLTQRIEAALAKLKAPQQEVDAIEQPLSLWWETLRQRHQHRNIVWRYESPRLHANRIEKNIPTALFDCVADNLIDNACNKALRERALDVVVELHVQPLRLIITDSGAAIPGKVARQLMQTVVSSEDGLGVGLYQAAKWAAQAGYRLVLSENREGKVSFVLHEE